MCTGVYHTGVYCTGVQVYTIQVYTVQVYIVQVYRCIPYRCILYRCTGVLVWCAVQVWRWRMSHRKVWGQTCCVHFSMIPFLTKRSSVAARRSVRLSVCLFVYVCVRLCTLAHVCGIFIANTMQTDKYFISWYWAEIFGGLAAGSDAVVLHAGKTLEEDAVRTVFLPWSGARTPQIWSSRLEHSVRVQWERSKD